MQYILSDIVIGNYPRGLQFGEKPEVYSARYNIRGHEGIDILCPSLTMVLATADGTVLYEGFDAGGYGYVIKILHDGFISTYAHLNDIQVKKDDRVIAGQLIGHSNNTGFSDSPHLHFGIAPVDANGVKTEAGNGYGGYIDPMSELCFWKIKNLMEPIVPEKITNPPIPVPADELSTKSIQSNNFLSIIEFVGIHGGLVVAPNDQKGAEKVNSYIADLLYQLKDVKNQPQIVNTTFPIKLSIPKVSVQKKYTLWQKLGNSITNFVFVSGGDK